MLLPCQQFVAETAHDWFPQATQEQVFSVSIPNVVAGPRTFVCRVQEDFASQVSRCCEMNSSWASDRMVPHVQ